MEIDPLYLSDVRDETIILAGVREGGRIVNGRKHCLAGSRGIDGEPEKGV